MMKKCLIALAATAAVVTPTLSQAQDTGSWIVRGRALYLDPANSDNTGLGLNLGVNAKLFPEVDITYFITPNIAAELVLTYPQKHDVHAGDANIGSLKHLPPTLTLQYHVPMDGLRPYIGAGVNYTRLSSIDLPAGVTADKNSWGLAVGAGVDVPIGGGWLFNVDVKKVQIKTRIEAGGNGGDLKVDPVLFSLGVGKRF